MIIEKQAETNILNLGRFVRLLELGEATVTPNSGGFNALEELAAKRSASS